MMRRIDLLPESYRARRAERRNLAVIVAVGVVVLLILVVWWFLLGNQISDQENQLQEAQAQNAQLQAQINQLQRFSKLDEEVQNKESALRTVMDGDVDWPAELTELAMVVPGDTWLTSLDASAGQTEGSTPAPSESNGIRLSQNAPFGRIVFQGNSLSMPGVGRWLVRLEGVKDFQSVWLDNATQASESTGGTNVITFQNTIELNDKAASNRFQQIGQP